jgi:hypothetical protein
VRCSSFPTRYHVLTVLTFFAVVATAHADPIPPSYTVTDLGSGVAFSGDPNANGVVTSFSGQTYAFPQTFSATYMPTPANFPILDPVPVGSNGTGYSSVAGINLYPNGIAIATDQVGFNASLNGSSSWQGADIYYVMRNPDGSWGQAVPLISAAKNYGAPIGYEPNVSATLSKSGVVLESTLMIPGTNVLNNATIFNINTQTYTELSTLPAIVNNGYFNLRALAIDDAGRILVWATHQSSNQGALDTDDLLLLTPAGVSSNPLPAAAPEPGAWLVMAFAMAGLAVHRIRETRRRS